MQAARSLLYAVIFYPATLLFVLAGIAATLAGTRPTRAVVHGWADFHHWLARALLGVRSHMEGRIPDSAVLIAVKHGSMYETVESLRIARTPVVVLKHELSSLPLFGWLTRQYGVIPVDRGAGARALRQMIKRGREAVSEGRPVLIFPEGTRVPAGSAPPLGSGFAGLYRALGLPVVPVAVDSARLWPRGLVKHRGTIRFKVGETIPPGLKRDEIERRVHAAINAFEETAKTSRRAGEAEPD